MAARQPPLTQLRSNSIGSIGSIAVSTPKSPKINESERLARKVKDLEEELKVLKDDAISKESELNDEKMEFEQRAAETREEVSSQKLDLERAREFESKFETMKRLNGTLLQERKESG
eukprot:CAMPEP_0184530226 /NCGR_PEP_ID=MMETSP0198_2-20121128/12830_1 /TAXON_ID=1112570 /ORGANISM="Thraustochytrium sp., Strain LLF1b" /LENGTH=116 /DNA_ID=CAMNT_0026922361 /DNA_START=155 /DNA_END=500 /DNA_ORIENTATION=+